MTDSPKASSVRSMNSVLNTLRILEEVAARQPIGVSELARLTGVPKSSVQRSLITLRQAGWLRMTDPDRARWGVTTKALAIGLRSAGEYDIRALAAPLIDRLATETGETVHLGLRDGDDLLVIARADGTNVVRVFVEIGERIPLRATSAGVAIMSHLDDAAVDEIIGHEPRDVAGKPPAVDEHDLRREIELAGTRGYASDMSTWYRPHVSSIGVAIMDLQGQPVAGLSLAVPQMRASDLQETELVRLTVDAATQITRLLATP